VEQAVMRIIKYSIRSFLKTPGFTAAALGTLALTVGAAATIFSVVNSTVIEPLPFRDAGRLAIVWHRNTQDGQDRIPISEVMLQRLAGLGGLFEQVGGLSPHWTFVVRRGDVPEPIRGFWVSHTLFPLLGASPTQGRVFRADEDRAGGPPVVIVSADLWAKHFGPGARLDGQIINVDNRAATVIGIMPEGFRLLDTADIWTPLQQNPFLTRTNGNLVRMWTAVARLRPGVDVDTASRESVAVAARLSEEFRNSNTNLSARAVSLKDDVVGTQREALLMLLGAVAFVLLIGCANVANLLLARAAARRRDVAVILALGAQRRVLWQNLLTEGALLAGAGTAAGILIAVWATSWIRTIDPAILPRASEVTLDVRVLAAAAAAAAVVSLAFAAAPAWQLARFDVAASLKEGQRSTRGRRGLRSALIIAEVALSLTLLTGAGLLMRSFVRVMNVDPGFAADRLLTLQVGVPPRYAATQDREVFYDTLFQRIGGLPGVEAVGGTTRLPMRTGVTTFMEIEGRASTPDARPEVEFRRASVDYFKAMRIPVIEGRAFASNDTSSAPRVAMINQTAAARFWPGASPLGARIRFFGNDPTWWTIVGVAGDVRHFGLEEEPRPELYMAFSQGLPNGPILAIRTSTDPAALAETVRRTIQDIDRDVVISNEATMSELVSDSMSRRRLTLLLLSGFAIAALGLSAVGLYGVLAYLVTERRQELGVRLALGATPRDLFKLVVGQGLALTGIGLAIGLAASLLLSHTIASLLYRTSPLDPVALVGVSVMLLVIAMLACAAPARRAANADPLIALKSE